MSRRPGDLVFSALFGLTLLLSLSNLPAARADLVPPSTNLGNPGAGGILDYSRVHPVIARRDDVADSVYTDNAVGYPSVGLLAVGSSVRASGTLIAPNVVLTAAHVFDAGSPVNTIFFTVGGSTYDVQTVVLSPTWTGFNASIGKGDDIAMIVLTSRVTNVAPASLYTGTDELGHVGIDVGFGYSGTGSTGHSGDFGTKRAGPNSVDQFGDFFNNVSHNILLQDFDKPGDPNLSTFGSTTPLAQESLITQGDSGGGMFIDFGTGPLLVGVHSFLDDQNNDGILSNYGDIGGSTRVSANLAFIETLVTVPEPASFVLFALGILGVGVAQAPLRKRNSRSNGPAPADASC